MARTKANMTQEKLSEIVHVSTSHISNIETGNSKMSLPTFIDIANALSTSADALLYDSLENVRHAFCREINSLLVDCDEYEVRFLAENLSHWLESYRKIEELKRKKGS